MVTFLTFLRINAVIILLTRNNLYSGLHFSVFVQYYATVLAILRGKGHTSFEACGNFLVPAQRLSLLQCGNEVGTCCFRGKAACLCDS